MNDDVERNNKKYESNIQNQIPIKETRGKIGMEMKEIISLAWGAKEDLRGPFKKHEWGGIILPFIVLRRLGRVLEPTKDKVVAEYEKIKKLDDDLVEARLNKITGVPFHNTSPFNLDVILRDEKNMHKNMKAYMRGFSKNVRDIFKNFKFDTRIDELHENKRLIPIIQRFAKVILDPNKIDNHQMGMIYEELILYSSEAGNEEAGEHFTPREVIRLMVNLLFAHDESTFKQKNLIRKIYDPAVGTGGMLSVATEYLRDELKSKTRLIGYGQEHNPESYAICKSDMMLKDLDLDNIKFGNSLTNEDGFVEPDDKFHYMISNPPYGVNWSSYESAIRREEKKKFDGKYGPGTPGVRDGSFLFLLNMISKMKKKEDGGSRIAIVFNGSPLFTGEAGSGESDIRKWLFEEDLVEAIVGLPDQLFYNTGINTYIWILTNNKPRGREKQVQLIDATSFSKKLPTSYNFKRNEIPKGKIKDITDIFKSFKPGEFSKIFKTTDFGYTRVTVERPLRRNFQINDKRLELLKQENAFIKLKDKKPKPKEPTQNDVLKILKKMPTKLYKNYLEFVKDLNAEFTYADFKLTSTIQKAIENSLGEKDETAEPFKKKDTDKHYVADSDLRDHENIPLSENIKEYFNREVEPHVKDAWIDEDTKNNVGYEIPFTRHFYKYKPLRPLKEIDAEIRKLQQEISDDLKELMK